MNNLRLLKIAISNLLTAVKIFCFLDQNYEPERFQWDIDLNLIVFILNSKQHVNQSSSILSFSDTLYNIVTYNITVISCLTTNKVTLLRIQFIHHAVGESGVSCKIF